MITIEANRNEIGVEYRYHGETPSLKSELTVAYHAKNSQDIKDFANMLMRIAKNIKDWQWSAE